jgi:hypothetical protein
MQNNVVSFEGHKAQKFIERGLLLYHGDPPDTDYQRGYLAGMVDLYLDCLNGPVTDSRIATVIGWVRDVKGATDE